MKRFLATSGIAVSVLLAGAVPSTAAERDEAPDAVWRYECIYPDYHPKSGDVEDHMSQCDARNGAQTGWGDIKQPFEVYSKHQGITYWCNSPKPNGAYGRISNGILFAYGCKKV